MTVEEYKNIRKIGVSLAYKFIDFEKNNRNDIIYAGKRLGFWDGQEMCFETEEESDYLMDFLLYEKNKNGIRLIDKIYNSDIELSEIEDEILEGMVNYIVSLFEVIEIDEKLCIVTVIDLLDKKKTEIKFIDIGFSKSIDLGMVFYSRLIPIRNCFMTSGVSFVFDKAVKNKIINEIAFAKLKKVKGTNPFSLFTIAYKGSKAYGLKVINKSIK